jgi:opacity protein-like surface antigen
MKNIKLIVLTVAASLSIATTSAYADTSEGYYAGFSLGGYNGGNTRINGGGSDMTYRDHSFDTNVGVFGGYNWNFGKEAVAAEISYNNSVGNVPMPIVLGGSNTTPGRLQNNYQVSILPGYNFYKNTEGYVRLGWTRADDGAISGSHAFNGTVMGLGVDQSVSRNIALRLEWQYMNFNSYSVNNVSYKPGTSGINGSLRYAF